ncbi:MAG TPA: alcohol dehydrogenase catalytic domain-containing protein [Acidobacteriota bacterium]|nr:alcohol dehydrogenase catalytic domain-containing protein [Acidobacteriota bacterium]
MKAAFLTGPGRIEVRDGPAPEIKQDRDVLVRVKTVGICGSDLHYFAEPVVGDTVMTYPVVLGHECAGVVEKIGPGVARVKPGDRVAVEPAASCGTCDQCRAGRFNTCRSISFLGHPKERTGALAELIVVPEESLFAIGARMTFAQATLAEPLSIALHSVNLAGALEGKTVAILGSGPIGLSIGLAARLVKAASVDMTDKIDDRVAAARTKAGARWTGNPLKTDVVREILALEPDGVDIVFECCGKQEAVDQAVEVLKPGGTLLLVGIPLDRRVSFDISRLRRRELRIQNVRRQNQCVGEALRLIAEGCLDLDFMATHTFPLAETQAAFETAFHYRNGVIKTLVAP